MRHRLPDDYRPRILEALHDCGVVVGHKAFEDPRAGLCRYAFRVAEVLDSYRDPVQRASRAATLEIVVGGFGLPTC